MGKSVTAATILLALFAFTSAALAETGTAEGEVRKVDQAAGKITVRHGPIEGMDMPPMTMVFRVKNATLLDKLKAGNAITFTVSKEQGAFYILSAELK